MQGAPMAPSSWRPRTRSCEGSQPARRSTVLLAAGSAKPGRDPLTDLFAGVLLQEVSGAGDRLLELGAGNQLGDPLGDTRREDRVRVAEEDERGAVPRPEPLANFEHLSRRR